MLVSFSLMVRSYENITMIMRMIMGICMRHYGSSSFIMISYGAYVIYKTKVPSGAFFINQSSFLSHIIFTCISGNSYDHVHDLHDNYLRDV